MVDFKNRTVNRSIEEVGPMRGFVGQASEVASNVFELAELQIKLFQADAARAVKTSAAPIGMIALSICLALVSLLVALFGLAEWIAYAFNLPDFAAKLAVGGLGIVIAMCTIALTSYRFKRSSGPFRRSADEFAQNAKWLKAIFQSKNRDDV